MASQFAEWRCAVGEAVVEAAEACRRRINGLLGAGALVTATDVQTFLDPEAERLNIDDCTSTVERSLLLQLCGKAAITRFVEKVSSCKPTSSVSEKS